MPGAFPASPPTLALDLETISRFLQSPTQIRRRLRSYVDLRFVADQMLPQRFRSSGGAVLYEMTEPFVTDQTVAAVQAGSEYPYANITTGTGAIAAVTKWGQKVLLTDEEIARNVYAGAAVDRSLRKVINSIISQVDAVAMAAIASAISAGGFATATGGIWSTPATGQPLPDILRAKAAIEDRNMGYVPDTVVLSSTQYAWMMANPAATAAWSRERQDTPIYTGEVQKIAGLRVVVTPHWSVTTEAVVCDSTQLGGMADEMEGSPGYAMGDLAVQVKSIRKDESDSWDLQGRRLTVPVVMEPGAAQRITGVV